MKIKGRNLIYIIEGIKDVLNAKEIYKELYSKYRDILPDEFKKIKEDDVFPFEIYLSLLEIIGFKKGKEFVKELGKKQGREFISTELRVAKKMDIDWVLNKAILIGESFYIGGKYTVSKISENTVRIKIEKFEEFNEFVEEEIKGFIEGVFEEIGMKIEIETIFSPVKNFPFLEFEIKW
ncbi:MAG: hypothetical protein ABIM36_04010 [candidate division WOR-3 bacterium]